MNIAIVGGGVAGLSTALLLSQAPAVQSILLLEKPCAPPSIQVGLWSTALEAVKRTNPALVHDLVRSGRFVSTAGYRSPQGNWLLRTTLPPHGNVSYLCRGALVP
jgi:2-polyprenyl-6-methoxyphenol hydroxylase-like FAD-dependent oxidoreductase